MKILIGLLAALVVAVGGYFGFEFYLQQRIANDIEATFASVRASGAKAEHGKVTFDLWRRTVYCRRVHRGTARQHQDRQSRRLRRSQPALGDCHGRARITLPGSLRALEQRLER